MKWFIISDIHGSSFYFDKAVSAYEKEKADKILILGDILYHGPRNDLPEKYDPKKIIPVLNGLKDKIVCVRGNCDTEVDQMVLDFPIMAEYIVLSEGGKNIYATHGHKLSSIPVNKGDIILHGHTHIPRCEYENDILYINPGSTSIPKSNSQNSYMILENGKFTWKTLDSEIYKEFII